MDVGAGYRVGLKIRLIARIVCCLLVQPSVVLGGKALLADWARRVGAPAG
jgi:hypothetical protein